jgi:hypothetical protein
VFSPIGTGFLASYKFEDAMFLFVVTAAHVFDLISGDVVCIRCNDKSGQAHSIKVRKDTAWRDADKTCDLVALPFSGDWLQMDHLTLSLNRGEWEEAHNRLWQPNLGDEVATVGLYGSHFGLLKNIPVVRVGHIAMMPGEPVMTSHGYVKAYLIEVKSIAGLSGSPVFLNYPDVRATPDGQVAFLRERKQIPIGMMLGYHVVETAQDQISVPQIQGGKYFLTPSVDERNTGFAVVLPFARIVDLFEDEDSQAGMKKTYEDHVKKSGYRDAGIIPQEHLVAIPVESEDANPNAKEDFTRLLTVAATKKPQAD